MKKLLLFATLLTTGFTALAKSPLPTITPSAGGIVYINKNSTGDGTGNSWANAVSELADALVAAKTNTSIQQIWVAAGTYKPLYSPATINFGNPDGRNNAFLVVKNVKVYGGFAGTESVLADRVLNTNKSILSGDLNNDDVTGSSSSNAENAYHVVISAGDVGIAELNGFTISGGNSNNPSYFNPQINVNNQYVWPTYGGGIFLTASSLVLNTVTISGNNATNGGAGIFDGNSSSVLTNVTISDNFSFGHGGGMFNQSGSPVLTNVVIKGNYGGGRGGGMYNQTASPSLTNVVITNNSGSLGGGMYNESNSSPVMTNVTLSGNYAGTSTGGIYNDDNSSATFKNSIVINNRDNYSDESHLPFPVFQNCLIDPYKYGGGTDIIRYSGSLTDLFKNPVNPARSTGGDYTLTEKSAAIDVGNNSLYIPYSGNIANDTDLAGNARLSGSKIDMGAYEWQSSTLPVTLTGFTAVAQNKNEAWLQWQTASEINNKGYGIEMSATGYVYQNVGFVQGSGTTSIARSYQTVVPNLVTGTNYFRLKITSLDGSFTYSPIKLVTVTGGMEPTMNAYPNPVTDGNMYIKIGNTGNTKTTIRITGALGRLITQADYRNVAAPIKIILPATKGAYYIEVTTGDGKTFSKKVMRL